MSDNPDLLKEWAKAELTAKKQPNKRAENPEAKAKIFNAAKAAKTYGYEIPDDVAEDFYELTSLESGRAHYLSDGKTVKTGVKTPNGDFAIGFSQVMGNTAKPYKSKGLNPYEETDNLIIGLNEFYNGDQTDAIARRLAYVGGANEKKNKALSHYRKTGEVPDWKLYSYLPNNKETFSSYVEHSGGFKPLEKWANASLNGQTTETVQGKNNLEEWANQTLTENSSESPDAPQSDAIKNLTAQKKQLESDLSRATSSKERQQIGAAITNISKSIFDVSKQTPSPTNDAQVLQKTDVQIPRKYTKRQIKPGDKFYEFEQTGKTPDGLDYLGQIDGKYHFKNADGDELELDENTNQLKPLGSLKRQKDADGNEYVRADNQDGVTNGIRYKNQYGVDFVFTPDGKIREENPAREPTKNANQRVNTGKTNKIAGIGNLTQPIQQPAEITPTEQTAATDQDYNEYLAYARSSNVSPISRDDFEKQANSGFGRGVSATAEIDGSRTFDENDNVQTQILQKGDANTPEVRLEKPDTKVNLKEANLQNIENSYAGEFNFKIITPSSRRLSADEAIEQSFLQLPRNVRETAEVYQKITGRELWFNNPEDKAIYQQMLDDTGAVNLKYPINRVVQSFVDAYASGGEESLRKAIENPQSSAYQNYAADVPTASRKFDANNEKSEAEAEKRVRESLQGNGLLDAAGAFVERGLESLNPITAIKRGFGQNDDKSDIQREIEDQEELEAKAAAIKKQYGSFENYEQKLKNFDDLDPITKTGEYWKHFGNVFVQGLVDMGKALPMLDKLEEKYNPLNLVLPEKYRISLSNVGNAIAYISGSQAPAELSSDAVENGRVYRALNDFKKEYTKLNPFIQNSTGGEIGSGVVSALQFFGVGMAFRGSKLATALAGGMMEAPSQYEQMRERGVNPDSALLWSQLVGYPLGATELVGIGGAANSALAMTKLGSELSESGAKTFLRSIIEFSKNRGKDILSEAPEEGLQEWFQSSLGQAAIEALSKQNPKDGDRVLEFFAQLPKQFGKSVPTALTAAVTGGIFGAGVGAATDAQNSINNRKNTPLAKMREFEKKTFDTSKIQIGNDVFDAADNVRAKLDESVDLYKEANRAWIEGQKLLAQVRKAPNFTKKKELLRESAKQMQLGNKYYEKSESAALEAEKLHKNEPVSAKPKEPVVPVNEENTELPATGKVAENQTATGKTELTENNPNSVNDGNSIISETSSKNPVVTNPNKEVENSVVSNRRSQVQGLSFDDETAPPNEKTEENIQKSAKPPREFSTTQVDFNEKDAAEVQNLGKKLIDEADVVPDGREDKTHATVNFGLHTNDVADVKKFLSKEKPFEVTLGNVTIFPAKEGQDFDVVKIDVDSPELHRLNKLISDNTETTKTQPKYSPHITLAKVKAGTGQKYVGDSSLEGKKVKFDSITFSDKNRNKIAIPLTGIAEKPSSDTNDENSSTNNSAQTAQVSSDSLNNENVDSTKKIVNVGGKDIELNPEQIERWTEEVEKPLAAAKAEFDNDIKKAEREEQSRGATNSTIRETANKIFKAKSMQISAIKREITGELTDLEREAAEKYEKSNYIGKEVSANGENGKVVGNPFGRVKVQFPDGSEKTFDRGDIAAPIEPAIETVESELHTDREIQNKAHDIISELYDEKPTTYSGKNEKVADALKGLAGILGDDILLKAAVLPESDFDEKQYEQTKPLLKTILDELGDPADNTETSLRKIITTLKNDYNLSKDGVIKLVPYMSKYLLEAKNNLQKPENETEIGVINNQKTAENNDSLNKSNEKPKSINEKTRRRGLTFTPRVTQNTENIVEKSDGILQSARANNEKITLKNASVEVFENNKLSPKKLQIQKNTIQRLKDNPSKFVEDYYAKHGNQIVNADRAKELFDEYESNRLENDTAVHAAASALARLIFDIRLSELPKNSIVTLTAGGQASGKSTIIEQSTSPLIYDSVMQNTEGNRIVIDKIANAGMRGRIAYVYRPIQNAAVSMLRRLAKIGRPVSENGIASGHFNSQQSFITDTNSYAKSKGFAVTYHETQENRGSKLISLEEFKEKAYNNIEEVKKYVRTAINNELENGKYSAKIVQTYTRNDDGRVSGNQQQRNSGELTESGDTADADERESGQILKSARPSVELLAPNGKPSILTPSQYKQVRTKAFKDWFGDWESDPYDSSQMLDENGEPRVFYHRTNNEFDTFDRSYHGSSTDAGWLGEGFYFYGEKDEAYGYGKKEITAFLNIRNPYYAGNEDNRRLANANDIETSKEFTENLQNEDYDGVYFNGDFRQETVAFNPNQIKSATDNNGEFDPNNPSILKKSRDFASASEINEIEGADLGELLESVNSSDLIANGYLIETASLPVYEIVRSSVETVEMSKGIDEPPRFEAIYLNPIDIKAVIKALQNGAKDAINAGLSATNAAKLESLAKTIEDAAKIDGSAIVYLFDDAIPHELWHKTGYQEAVDKKLAERHSPENLKKLANSEVVKKLRDGAFSTLYPNASKSVIVEETSAWLAGGGRLKLNAINRELGVAEITEDEADNFLVDWAFSFKEKNPNANLDEFAKINDYAKRIIEKTNRINNRASGIAETNRRNEGQGRDAEESSGNAPSERSETEPDGKIKTRQTVLSAEKSGVVEKNTISGDARYYKVKSRDANVRAAQDRIEKLGLANAYNEAITAEPVEGKRAEYNAFLMELASLYHSQSAESAEAGDMVKAQASLNSAQQVITVLAEKGTDFGQAISQLANWQKTDPQAVTGYVQKRRSQNDYQKPLTPKESKILRDSATEVSNLNAQIADLQNKIDELEKKIADNKSDKKRRNPIEKKIAEDLAKKSANAVNRLKARFGIEPILLMARPLAESKTAQMDAGALQDFSDVGADILMHAPKETPVSVAEFKKQMTDIFGADIIPHLSEIHALSVKNLKQIKSDAYRARAVEALQNVEGNEDLTIEDLNTIVDERIQKIKDRNKLRNEHKKEANKFTKEQEKLDELDDLPSFAKSLFKVADVQNKEILVGALLLETGQVRNVDELVKKIRQTFPNISSREALNTASMAARARKLAHNDLEIEREKLRKERTDVQKESSKIKKERNQAVRQLLNRIKYLENKPPSYSERLGRVYQSALVSAVQTSVNNFLTAQGTRKIEAAADLGEVLINKTLRKIGELMGKELNWEYSDKLSAETRIEDVLGFPDSEDYNVADVVKHFFSDAIFARGIANSVLDESPMMYEALFGSFASDIAVLREQNGANGKADWLLQQVEKGFDKVNTLNSFQEFFIRSQEFNRSLQLRLGKRDLNLPDIVKNNQIAEKITEEDLQFAVTRALRVTFALKPDKDTNFGRLVNLYKDTVPGILSPFIVTFPNFLFNATKFVSDYAPAVGLAKAGYKAAINKNDSFGKALLTEVNPRVIAQQTVGTILFLAALGLVRMAGDDDKWYYLKTPFQNKEGEHYYMDVRGYQPFASLIFLANKVNRGINGKPIFSNDDTWATETLEAMTGLSTRNLSENKIIALGEYGLKATGESFGIYHDDEKNWERLKYVAQQQLGEIGGGFLRPLKTVKDLVAQFNEFESKQPDTIERPGSQGIARSLPFANTILGLEPRKDFVTGKESSVSAPGLKIFGISVINPDFHKEIPSKALVFLREELNNFKFNTDVLPNAQRKREVKSALLRALSKAENDNEKLQKIDDAIKRAESKGLLSVGELDFIERKKGLSELEGLANRAKLEQIEQSIKVASDSERTILKKILKKKQDNRQEETENKEIDKIKTDVREGNLSIENADRNLQEKLRKEEISAKEYIKILKDTQISGAVEEARKLNASSSSDLEKIEKLVKSIEANERQGVYLALLEKVVNKIKSKDTKAIKEAEKLYKIIEDNFPDLKKK